VNAAVPVPEQPQATKVREFRVARLKTVAMIRWNQSHQIFNSKNFIRRGNKSFAAELIYFA
jgi:hypothetical protein